MSSLARYTMTTLEETQVFYFLSCLSLLLCNDGDLRDRVRSISASLVLDQKRRQTLNLLIVSSGEAVEVTGPAGTSLDGWSIPLYNGNGGGVCESLMLCVYL